MNQFNLITDAWIPVRWLDGRSTRVSLKEAFLQSEAIENLDCSPPERVSLMRLLVCLTQRANPPPEDESEADWEALRESLVGNVLVYLEQPEIYRHFELFGPGPRFLQRKVATSKESVPASKLFPALASGNNATLFDQAGDDANARAFAPADLALALLSFQNFYPLYGAGYKGKGPCVDSNMVHTYFVGKNLLETIVLACLDLDSIQIACPQEGLGQPLWELDDKTAAGKAMATQSYLGRLVPRHRNLWLKDDGTGFWLEKNSLQYPTYEEIREPSATVVPVPKKAERRLLSARLERALWRDLHEITVVQAGQSHAPLTLQVHWEHVLKRTQLWTGALVTDLKAKIINTVESTRTVPRALFTPEGNTLYQKGMEEAEACSKKLWAAVKNYWEAFKNDSPPIAQAQSYYWTALEGHLQLLLDAVASEDKADTERLLGEWRAVAYSQARAAFQRTCPAKTPRQMKAHMESLNRFRPAKKQPSKKDAA
ncbi:MAG: type I-E CRISPR-associated protein Cse1/CasA [Verrucomicrobiota bacterium JB022]|nr:type I-E CRISPR-associated protein Cse1/CasA [Verrucomicrobiota bacterium JB022]